MAAHLDGGEKQGVDPKTGKEEQELENGQMVKIGVHVQPIAVTVIPCDIGSRGQADQEQDDGPIHRTQGGGLFGAFRPISDSGLPPPREMATRPISEHSE